MKKTVLFLVSLLLFGGILPANIFASHDITYFRDGKSGAVTVGFDDGYASQMVAGFPQLEARNLKGTLFAITSWVGHQLSWDNLRDLASRGHEIGSHSVNHPDLTTLTEPDIRFELSESQRLINQNVPSQSCVTLGYPYNKTNAQVQGVVSDYYIAARAAWSLNGGYLNHYEDGSSWKAVNFFEVGGHGIYDDTLLADIDSYLNSSVQQHAWYFIYFHEIQNVDFYNQILDHVTAQNVWVDTFGSIARYMRERQSSSLILLSQNNTEIRLNLTHSLDSSIYNKPLTIRSTVPSWSKVRVQQGVSVYFVKPVVEAGETVVYYDALPNGGEILLTEAVATITLGNLNQIYDRSPKSVTATTNPPNLAVSFTYNGSPNPPVNAGSYAVVATITDGNYEGSAAGTLVIAKATPTITWANPADIVYGTALSATQLNATASGTGTLNYTPPAGTVLNVGNNQTLHVTFTPADTVNYNSASKDVKINVTANNPGPAPTIISLNPSSVTAGSAGFSLLLTGRDFASNAVVRWNGYDCTTTHISSFQVRAAIPASYIAAPGTASCTVYNPPGSTSNAATFSITGATLFNFTPTFNYYRGGGFDTIELFVVSGTPNFASPGLTFSQPATGWSSQIINPHYLKAVGGPSNIVAFTAALSSNAPFTMDFLGYYKGTPTNNKPGYMNWTRVSWDPVTQKKTYSSIPAGQQYNRTPSP